MYSTPTVSERIDRLERERRVLVGRMEDALHRQDVAQRNGSAGWSPDDAQAFEQAKHEVLGIDAQLRELRTQQDDALTRTTPAGHWEDELPRDLGLTPVHAASARHALPSRVDVRSLYAALRRSHDRTSGPVECSIRALIQGGGTGNLVPVRVDGGMVVQGLYGALPLVLAVQVLPCEGGVYNFSRLGYKPSQDSPPAPVGIGGKQSSEGTTKALVELASTPVELTLGTYAAYERVSVQALDDHFGLAAAMESLLTSATFRAADADAWTAFSTHSTPLTPQSSAAATLVTAAARVAAAGGTGVRAVLNPLDAAAMALARTDSGTGPWLGLPAGAVMPQIVQSSGVPQGQVLVTASTDGAFTAMRQSVTATVGVINDDLIRNLRTMLLEGRMAADVRNPAFAYIGALTS